MFLRFFCPAILAPDKFGVVNDPLEPAVRKNLTMVAKVIQNVSNGVEFGVKEPHMVVMNPVIKYYMEKLAKFLVDFSTVAPRTSKRKTWTKREAAVYDGDLVSLFDIVKKTIVSWDIPDAQQLVEADEKLNVSRKSSRRLFPFKRFVFSDLEQEAFELDDDKEQE